MIELLRRLSLSFGVGPCVGEVKKIVQDELCTFPFTETKRGSLIYRLEKPGKKKILLSAHLDEVGFMITQIEDDGLLSFGTVGGISSAVIGAKRVQSENGIHGTILSKPIHLLSAEEKETLPKDEEYRIDIGAKSKEEAQKDVSVGDYFTFESDFVRFGDGLLKGKALDDRLGVAILISVLKELKRCAYDLTVGFSFCEETGYTDACCVTEIARPEIALVVESTAVADLPNVPREKQVAHLGNGGALSFRDRATIYDEKLTSEFYACAESRKIPIQWKEYVSGGNDALAIQKKGVKVMALSAPSRYIHSGANVVCERDLFAMKDAILAFLEADYE